MRTHAPVTLLWEALPLRVDVQCPDLLAVPNLGRVDMQCSDLSAVPDMVRDPLQLGLDFLEGEAGFLKSAFVSCRDSS